MSENKIFQNRVALITGGTRGIGAAICNTLASKGCSIAFTYLSNHDKAQELTKTCAKYGVKAHAFQLHLGNPTSLEELWKNFDLYFNKIDYLILNAATGVFKPIMELSLNSVKKVLSANFESIFSLIPNAVKRMPFSNHNVPGNRGRIVSLSSLGAERVIQNYGIIGASKAAMELAIKHFAFELGSIGINCNIVRAGLVITDAIKFLANQKEIIDFTLNKTPNKKIVTVEDVANVVAFLLTDEASMINGQIINVDGGYNLNA